MQTQTDDEIDAITFNAAPTEHYAISLMYSQLKFEYLNSKNQSVDCKASAGERSDVCTSRCWNFFPAVHKKRHSQQPKGIRNKSFGLLSSVTANFIHSSCSPLRRDVRSTDMNNEWVFRTRMCLPKIALLAEESQCDQEFLFSGFHHSPRRSEKFAIGDNLTANIDFKVDDGRRFSAHKVEKFMTRSESN